MEQWPVENPLNSNSSLFGKNNMRSKLIVRNHFLSKEGHGSDILIHWA